MKKGKHALLPQIVLLCIISSNLAPVVRRLDSALDLHWIKLYPMNNAIPFAITYPLDSNSSVG